MYIGGCTAGSSTPNPLRVISTLGNRCSAAWCQTIGRAAVVLSKHRPFLVPGSRVQMPLSRPWGARKEGGYFIDRSVVWVSCRRTNMFLGIDRSMMSTMPTENVSTRL